MFTKGEWRATDCQYGSGEKRYDVETDDEVIAMDVTEANANLIAQSPRMAKFLENLCAEWEDYGKIDDTFYDTARRILRNIKARGEE